MNAMPEHVATTTLSESHLDRHCASRFRRRRRHQPVRAARSSSRAAPRSCGPVGSCLVDELPPMVFPVVIGGGQTISPEQRNTITLEPTTAAYRFYRPRLDPAGACPQARTTRPQTPPPAP